ncbi:hypothetical protein LMG28688_04352 [Paraburkholderia caffeinitolerans]|uniref:Uncharacterized protein n=1 Tax=Paraburkholderia caffeinitolerans TaxID=1723730 RepID=A0A6J5GAE6_9BURK|nr:hypothetical protein [Paraburkholderia caffeinitolerans]CAB3796612.1 hypothetical protein LMG28688_04352 [Paraburkholderia caffeinitolerans]
MADTRRYAHPHRDTQRAFELQPVRSRAWRWGVALAWTAAAASAGAGLTAWALYAGDAGQCPAVAPDVLQTRLSNAELALEQERAERSALQKAADAAQAETVKLQADLVFLRNHGARPNAR